MAQRRRKRKVAEAPTVMAPKLKPEKGLDQVDEKVLYRGWLPVDDELSDDGEEIGRLALEAFVRGLVRQGLNERKKRRKKGPKTWDVGGPISTGPGNPGFGSSGGAGGGAA